MTKKNIYLQTALLFLLLFLPLLQSKVFAQTPTDRMVYTCLNVQHCYERVPGSDRCTASLNDDYYRGHRSRLTQTSANIQPADTNNTYLVECFNLILDGGQRTVCTTGDNDRDRTGGFMYSDTKSSYEFLHELEPMKYGLTAGDDNSKPTRVWNTTSGAPVELTNPQYSISQNGKLSVADSEVTSLEWGSYTKESYSRSFAIVTKYQSSPNPTPTPISQTQGGLQQGDLSFVSSCQTVAWDPLGYAYDIQTGDPIPNIDISASYSQTETGEYIGATEGLDEDSIFPPGTLPIRTNSSGFYSFFGKTGYYKMELSSIAGAPNSRHIQQTEQNTINQAVSALYPKTLNYYFDNSFYEGPVLKTLHLPVSMSPGSNPYNFSVVNFETVPSGNTITVKGQTTGPANVLVNICSTTDGVKNCLPTPYRSLNPSNGGPRPSNYFRFSMTLDQSVLSPGQEFDFNISKFEVSPPATPVSKILKFLVSKLVGSVEASGQSVSFTVSSIPSYLEGYLYDSEGRVLRNTQFGIYVSYNQDPYFSTTTDSNGFYRITSEFLPNGAYEIRFTNPNTNSQEALSTTQILAQNKEFIEVEKVNPFLETSISRNPRRNITPEFTPRPVSASEQQNQPTTSITQVESQPENSPADTTSNQQSQGNIMALIAIIILLVILSVGVAIYFIKKRAKNADLQE